MSILKIARMGHPVLRRVAAPVEDIEAPQLQRLIDDMIETMHDSDGVGLAAPQVHESSRLVVFQAPPAGTEDVPRSDWRSLPVTVLINPEIEILDKRPQQVQQEDWEGCLSVPDLRGLVPRPAEIRYRGLSRDGHLIDRVARDFHARVVLHECDHLDGVLYPMLMTDLRKLVYISEMQHQLSPVAKEADMDNPAPDDIVEVTMAESG